jgi:hypothetical protein
MNPVLTSLKRAFSQPAFLVAVLALGICGLSLNSALAVLQVKLHKLPLDLRVTLKEGIPQKLGHWVSVSQDQAIDPEVEQVLGTSKYIFRDYVDDRKLPSSDIDKIKEAPAKVRELMLAQLQTSKPSAVLRVGITYYTGSADTVAHVPERCYVADGFEVKQYTEVSPVVGNYPDGSPRILKYRFLDFEDQTGIGSQVQRVARNVGYVFHCDGEYESSSYKVRQHLQDLFERYGYYAKIEMMTAATMNPAFHNGATDANDQSESKNAMDDFLAEALPEFEKCLPDWKAAHAKK